MEKTEGPNAKIGKRQSRVAGAREGSDSANHVPDQENVSELKRKSGAAKRRTKSCASISQLSAPARISRFNLLVIPFASSSTISSNTATLGDIEPGFIPYGDSGRSHTVVGGHAVTRYFGSLILR